MNTVDIYHWKWGITAIVGISGTLFIALWLFLLIVTIKDCRRCEGLYIHARIRAAGLLPLGLICAILIAFFVYLLVHIGPPPFPQSGYNEQPQSTNR